MGMQTNNEVPVLDREPIVVDRATRTLYQLATRVAATDCTVLLNGESGTGKEILARFIHDRSPRATAPFVAINCAAIPENMLEAMLFGYERGAFTGATNSHMGKFEQAQGGTLLLDEITEMPLALQAKLLRVLQEREVERLGARAMLSLDVRVIATTNRDLRALVQAGNFREDLYYRLCVFPMTIPALRERRDDVLPLAMRLLELRSPRGARIPALSADAAQLLLAYRWPGNIRELDNLLQRAMILAGATDSGTVIEGRHIRFEGLREEPSRAPESAPQTIIELNGKPLRGSLRAAENQILLNALRAGFSRREVADKLGISPRTLRYKLAQLRSAGLDVPAA
jgi:two-component system response regulator FlrC